MGFFLVDMVTKYFFYDKKIGAEFGFVEPVFNTGVSWGIALPSVLVLVVTVFALGLFFWMYYKKYFPALVLVFFVAGTLGNFVDRLVLGGVRDFISIGQFPVFNLADVWLNVAVWVFVYFEFFHRLKRPEKK